MVRTNTASKKIQDESNKIDVWMKKYKMKVNLLKSAQVNFMLVVVSLP